MSEEKELIIEFADEYPLEHGMGTIEPFIITEYDGVPKLEIYSELLGLAEEFAELFEDNLFSREAIGWLCENIKPALEMWGGYRNWRCDEYTYEDVYVCDSDTVLSLGRVMPETRRLDDISDSPINITGSHITGKMYDGDDYDYISFGSECDGKIVSICAENSHWMEDEDTEIGVTTHPDYRGRGYAVSNLVSCCRHIIEKGVKLIWYSCRYDNIPSKKTAEAAGLKYLGRRYIFIAENDNAEDDIVFADDMRKLFNE